MNKKLEYSFICSVCIMANLLLLDTRFNIVGLFFGILGFIAGVKALRIKR